MLKNTNVTFILFFTIATFFKIHWYLFSLYSSFFVLSEPLFEEKVGAEIYSRVCRRRKKKKEEENG